MRGGPLATVQTHPHWFDEVVDHRLVGTVTGLLDRLPGQPATRVIRRVRRLLTGRR